MEKSIKVSRIRVGFQIGLHVFFIAHILGYYYVSGGTFLGSLEFQSFFHDFLGNGLLTAGALLMVIALLMTLVFGRLFCSWGCHFGAFQDLSAWILKKCGWSPPFLKTRFLHWVPYALLGGIFILTPVQTWMARGKIPMPRLDVAANPPLGSLPGWLGSAVLFLACGLGILLFLGTRGFCRFICPYGASFRLLDPISPYRIRRVKPCGSSCGLPGDEHSHPCTLACPTAVDVHEETRLLGAVRDRDCIRCHLCIEACPNQALAYTFKSLPVLQAVSPPEQHSIRTPYTLPVASEILVACVTLIAFLAWDLTIAAHFLAAALALGEGFLAFLVLEVVRQPEFSLGRIAFKRGGRWTFAAITVLGLFFLSFAPLVQGGVFKVLRREGDSAFNRLFPEMAEEVNLEAGSRPVLDLNRGGAAPVNRQALLERASKIYELALRILPGHSATLRRQIVTLAEMGNRQAIELAEQLQQSDPGPWSDELQNWVKARFSAGKEK